ncbi:MAG: Holliday junction resolvase RuvX [Bacteroidales bacterium]|nr:Holliday junction resolvase RuvX [Bacteroidales bacterium]
MGRIIGIDYGRKRTGIAVTDPMKIIASRLDTLSSVTVIPFLKDYIAKNDVECIVVGYPKQLNNQGSESLKYINPFLQKLVKEFPDMKIEQMDERFTSKIAFQTMIDAGVKKKDRQDKGLVDGVSATIILQSYLDKISHF